MDAGAVKECVRIHEHARLLWNDQRWLEARNEMAGCVEEHCPAAIRSECRFWRDEITRTLPSVLLVIERDEPKKGHESAVAELDGKVLGRVEPFARLDVDPGTHRVRVLLPGYDPIERSLDARPGKKNIVMLVSFKSERPAPMIPLRITRPVPAVTYWSAGGALLALGISQALLWSALAARKDAARCKPACGADVVDGIKTKAILADVAGVTGFVLAGLSLTTFIQRPEVAVPATALKFRATQTSAALELEGAF